MFEVKDKNKIIWFSRQEDAGNYNDYLKNGLKVIRKDNKTFYYNNGDKLIDVSMQGEKARYVLRYHNGKTATSERLQKKHIQAITQ